MTPAAEDLPGRHGCSWRDGVLLPTTELIMQDGAGSQFQRHMLNRRPAVQKKHGKVTESEMTLPDLISETHCTDDSWISSYCFDLTWCLATVVHLKILTGDFDEFLQCKHERSSPCYSRTEVWLQFISGDRQRIGKNVKKIWTWMCKIEWMWRGCGWNTECIALKTFINIL